MQFKNIIGQQKIKGRLLNTVKNGRISHAQLFLGKGVNGKLALAVAYAQYINCPNKTETDSCGVCSSCIKYQAMSHPDLFFSFPVNKAGKSTGGDSSEKKGGIEKSDQISKNAKSSDLISTMFYRKWLEYLRECNYYAELQQWYKKIEIGDKQGIINVNEARRIVKDLSYKPTEAEYKVLIIWQPEKMNGPSANLLLKFFEEPPERTLIIMVSDEKDQLLTTIQSRFQIIPIPRILDADMRSHLKSKFPHIDAHTMDMSIKLAGGDLQKTYSLIEEGDDVKEHFLMFQSWMRMCYKKGSLEEIKGFVEKVSRIGRENQKHFLNYSLRLVRECSIANYGHPTLNRLTGYEADWLLKFAPFIHVNNRQIVDNFDKAIIEIGRNANPSVLFMSLSLDLSQLLKIKP